MRKCSEKDRKSILAYISSEPETTLFFYGDIESYGVDKNPVAVWVDEKDEAIESLILQYRNTMFTIYSQNVNYDAKAVADFLKGQKVTTISGKEEIINKLSLFFPDLVCNKAYICRCNKVNTDFLKPLPKEIVLRNLTKEDAIKIAELDRTIDEFSFSINKGSDGLKKEVAKICDSFLAGCSYVGLFNKDELISSAGTSASSSLSAMVVAVATKKGYRGKGYASWAVSYLCKECFKTGKKFLCLFYDNPEAGKIYHKIGFEEVGKYDILHKNV